VYAIYEIKMGRRVTYTDAISVGFKKWFFLFAARFVAGFLILLGLVALIIPGIILAIRYSLLDEAVVLEDKGGRDSRSRSTTLTVGKRREIFNAFGLFFISYAIFGAIIYLPLSFFESLDIMLVGVVLDCVMDIFFTVIEIVIFLYYWEAVRPTTIAEPANEPDVLIPAADPPH